MSVQGVRAMTTITFDTLKFVHRLRDAGIPEPQAEAIAEAFKDASGEADLATKADVADVRRDIAEAKVDLLKWMFGALAAQTAFLSAIKFFGH
ncbi:DUF1640 domain-containing protein [uncultured Gammaproteobacteria bacterium]